MDVSSRASPAPQPALILDDLQFPEFTANILSAADIQRQVGSVLGLTATTLGIRNFLTRNDLLPGRPGVVRLLPSLRLVMSRSRRPGAPRKVTEDVRTICSCQVHARRNNALWRRTLRVARRTAGSLKARGIAVIVSVPLALGALEFPTEAMHLAVTALPESVEINAPFVRLTSFSVSPAEPRADATLPIFTTDSVRQQFLASVEQPRTLTADMIKEQFFRTHVPYGSIIYREARRNNLPPELVAAVVEAESDFRPRLISHKNAQGLMQIIPSTGRFLGAGDLFNPAENIAAGTKYLRYLHKRFKGDERMVLAAYNAGEGNVERFGGIPPFRETINYLQRVNTRAHQYRKRVRAAYTASMKMQNSQRLH